MCYYLISHLSSLVQSVFEVTIRVMGGLLSAHSYARTIIPNYQNELLSEFLSLHISSLCVSLSLSLSLSLPNRYTVISIAIHPINLSDVCFCGPTEKAEDLGYRLLPAFRSPTGIPYPKINLKTGRVGRDKSTSLAEASTLLVEFGVLSRYSNSTIFERVAKRALQEIWKRRSNKV